MVFCFESFEFKVEQIEKFEKAYAQKNNKLHLHLQTWRNIRHNRCETLLMEQNQYINQYLTEIENI